MSISKMRNRPPGIMRIYDAASKLIKPSLTPLYQVFLDQKSAVQEERSKLLCERDAVRQEGFEAAVRLRIACSDTLRIERGSYFERIEHKEDTHDAI